MKLDATDLRYITSEEFRVLTAVRSTGLFTILKVLNVPNRLKWVLKTMRLYLLLSSFKSLACEMGVLTKSLDPLPNETSSQGYKMRSVRWNLYYVISPIDIMKDDGYRLTYGGYDYLAMRALSKRDSMYSVGNQIGVGKESGSLKYMDLYEMYSDVLQTSISLPMPKEMRWFSNYIGTLSHSLRRTSFLPFVYRLGRVSFRAIKSKRDYMGKRKSASWMYMSRLSAQKEWAFMKVWCTLLFKSQFDHLSGPARARLSSSKTSRSGQALYFDGIYWCISSVTIPLPSRTRETHQSVQSSSVRFALSGKTLLEAHGHNRPFRSIRTHPRWFQWIQYPHPSRKRRTHCHWLPPNGQYVPC